jgi:polysaccharide export outer membrane protein
VLGSELTKQVRVDGEGDISLPMLPQIRVAGLTVHQAEQLIAKKLSEGELFNDPQVSVIQKEYSTQEISVLGEVQKPGTYPLLGPHTLLEALSAAGGTTLKAGNDVSILHASSPNDAVHVNVAKLDRSNVAVLPGDTIVVSKAGTVYVVGDVKQPSGIVMENTGLTVLKAIAMAQGANPTASLDRSKLIRNTPKGREEYPIKLKKIFENKAPDPTLQADDILFIPNSAAKSAARRGLEAVVQTATGVAIYRPY